MDHPGRSESSVAIKYLIMVNVNQLVSIQYIVFCSVIFLKYILVSLYMTSPPAPNQILDMILCIAKNMERYVTVENQDFAVHLVLYNTVQHNI